MLYIMAGKPVIPCECGAIMQPNCNDVLHIDMYNPKTFKDESVLTINCNNCNKLIVIKYDKNVGYYK